jgi:hypothetical protein
MRHERGWAGTWSARAIAEANAFDHVLFGPRRWRHSQPSFEDYARDYFPRPTRPPTALKGSEFGKRWLSNTAPADWGGREDAIARELTSGNVAPYLWQWKEIVARESSPRAVYLVMPDVLAIGSDTDFLRIPMDAITAQRVADHYACLLPTAKMVNQIFEQASAQLVSITKQYNWRETSRTDPEPDRSIKGSAMAGYIIHHDLIEAQLKGRSRDQLVAGHKKEVIIAPGMEANPDKLYFCGFHHPTKRGPGNPNGFFQRGSGPSIHPSSFADYAQGVRLVNPYMTIDGETKLVADVLKDRSRCLLISSGVIAKPGYRTTR